MLESGDRMFPGNSGRFNLVRCLDCGFYFQDPRPGPKEMGRFYPEGEYYSYQLQEEIPGNKPGPVKRIKRHIKNAVLLQCYGYPAAAGTGRGLGWERFFKRAVTERLFSYKPMVPYLRGGRMLEIGCGAGQTLQWYQRHGWEVKGTELSRTAADNARKLGISVFNGEIDAAGFKENSFDAVLLFDTIEHLHRIRETLREIRRVLKPSGRLFITTPDISSLEARVFKGNWPALDLPRHLYHFNKRSLSQLLRQTEYRVLTIGSTTAPGGLGDCLRYLYEDLTSQGKNLQASVIGAVVGRNRLVIFLWAPITRILAWCFGLSGGLLAVAGPGMADDDSNRDQS